LQFAAVFVLVLVLGLRKGEVLGLSWSAVDMQGRELTIDQQLQRVRRELLLRQTKTAASDGTLPIPDLVATALELRRADQEKTRRRRARVGGGCLRVHTWCSPASTGRLSIRGPSTRRFTARCDQAGVRHMTVHDTRRTCATLLVDLEVLPRVIMRILRHADVSMTLGDLCERQLDGDQRSAAQAGGVPTMSTVAVLSCGGHQPREASDGQGGILSDMSAASVAG